MSYTIAILVYGDRDSGRDALKEEKYEALGKSFKEKGFHVESVLYSDGHLDHCREQLSSFDAVLVWVNPVEKGNDRTKLDAMLKDLGNSGIYISAHPDVILKIGTKDILYKTRKLKWGSETLIYRTFDEFRHNFPASLGTGSRVIKQFRGNGGNGVYRIIKETRDKIVVLHAAKEADPLSYTENDFYNAFKNLFNNGGLLIDQPWNENLANGMVRCYLSGCKVAGFGYQEINALYPASKDSYDVLPPSKRFYFTEKCALFSDLKEAMEKKWVNELMEVVSIQCEDLPLIWDADFFINKINTSNSEEKYTLCEINVSSVSPFPPSAINFIVDSLKDVLNKKSRPKPGSMWKS